MPRGIPRAGHRIRSLNITGLLGSAAHSLRPALVDGAIQHGGEVIPATCTKCGAPWFVQTYWEARCLCGRTFYRTVGVIRRPTRKEPPA